VKPWIFYIYISLYLFGWS